MLTAAAIGIAVSVALVLWVLLAAADDKATVRAALRQLDGYELENVRDQQLLKPVKERTLAPLAAGLTGMGKRYTPESYVEKVQRKFTSAGRTGQDAIDRFLAIRVVTIALVPVSFIIVYFVLGMHGMTAHGLFGLLALVLILGPDARINRQVAERKAEVRKSLPDVLDLLVISVEAGLGFEQALDRTVASVPGALTDEFGRMLGEVRAGASRSEAMRAMEKRCDIPELRSFVLAMIQADTFGVSIGRVLRAQADEMRMKRRQFAQEKAQKAPVKMLVPMVFCVFPALFVVVIGPAVINISHGFK